jgi:hypothetical protein
MSENRLYPGEGARHYRPDLNQVFADCEASRNEFHPTQPYNRINQGENQRQITALGLKTCTQPSDLFFQLAQWLMSRRRLPGLWSAGRCKRCQPLASSSSPGYVLQPSPLHTRHLTEASR